MYRVFNMGAGLIVAAAPEDAAELTRLVPTAIAVGEVTESTEPRVTWR